jgi:hypothetical protein
MFLTTSSSSSSLTIVIKAADGCDDDLAKTPFFLPFCDGDAADDSKIVMPRQWEMTRVIRAAFFNVSNGPNFEGSRWTKGDSERGERERKRERERERDTERERETERERAGARVTGQLLLLLHPFFAAAMNGCF